MLYLIIMGVALAINVAATRDRELSVPTRAAFGVSAIVAATLMIYEVKKLLT